MKVIAFNGSARKDGNTAILINYVLKELEKEGIDTEIYQLSGKKIHGCIACRKCAENLDQRCAVKDDVLNDCIEKMLEADGIILGSPTYVGDVSSQMKALIDRAGFVSKMNGCMFKRKIGAGVVAARRGGLVPTFYSLNNMFFLGQMIIPCSSYWNICFGREKGEVENDEEGIQTMKVLGENIAWLLKKIHG